MVWPLGRVDFERLVDEHLPDAPQFAMRLTNSPDLAEDVVQDAMVSATRNWKSFRGDSSFRTWLWRIVINAYRDRFRKQRTSEQVSDQLVDSGQRDPSELAATRLLTRVSTWRSYSLLLELRGWSVVHVEVVRALGRLSNPGQLARLARAESDLSLRRDLMGQLLECDSETALRLYLGFVANPVYSADALSSVGQVSSPPVESLFGYLDNPRLSLRIASARVLGRLDDPAISTRLVLRVSRQEGLREALIALLESKNKTAQLFVFRARQDVTLAASVRAAQSRVASFPN